MDTHRPFAEHLDELKKRFMWVAFAFVVGSGIGFLLHKQIEHILQKPLGQTLYFSAPGGGLTFVVQISVGAGLILALPVALFQFAQFVRPAVKPIKTRTIVAVVCWSMILSMLAILYTYFISLPSALKFLVSFNSSSVQALINVNDYMRFIFAYFAGSIIAFQFPLILIFINKIRRIPPGGLMKSQKPVILGIVIVSGILTPTVDPFNQLLMAIPMFALYESGVMAVWITNMKVYKQTRRAANTPRMVLRADRIRLARSMNILPNLVYVEKVTSVPRFSGVNMDGFVSAKSAVRLPKTRSVKELKPKRQPQTFKRPSVIMDIMMPTTYNNA